jgi:hypothetical protein
MTRSEDAHQATLALLAQKARIEDEITQLESRLVSVESLCSPPRRPAGFPAVSCQKLGSLTWPQTRQSGVGLTGNLVDEDGFPRADVDVHGIRIIRNQLASMSLP